MPAHDRLARVPRVVTAYPYSAWETERSCLTKRGYATRSEAQRAKRVMTQKTGRIFSIYACAHCGGWHLTSQGREVRGIGE